MNPQRGYLEIELGGEKRTLHFSMNFWAFFEKHSGKSISELAQTFVNGFTIESLRTIIFCGLMAHDSEQRNEINYDEIQVGMWMDDLGVENIEQITVAMMSSKMLNPESTNAGVRRGVSKSTKEPKK